MTLPPSFEHGRRPPAMRWSLIAGAICALFLAGCDEEPNAGRTGDSSGEATTSKPAATNPADDGEDFGEWEEEAFATAAGFQLAELKHLLKGEESSTDFSGAVSAGLTGFPMNTVREDGAFAVRQGSIAKDAGPQPLREALAPLLQRFQGGKAKLAEIKIVRVGLSDDEGRTELFVHLAGPRLQVNAVWEATWHAAPEPVLKALETKSYEECERLVEGRLTDATGSVLAGGMPEVEQFARGTDHWVARIETLFGIQVGGWHGLAVADVNGDGLDDLYVPDGGGLPNRLLVQQPDGRVLDRSRDSGLDLLGHSHGALFADFDNDGDQDAAVTQPHGVLFFANDGTGRFSVASSKLFPESVAYSLSAADYDQDGDLDLFVACYMQQNRARRHSFVARPVPYHDADNGGRNELLRNDGNLRFRIVTQEAGLGEGNRKFSYSASWDDYDDDGDLDLCVANDFGSNHLYQNQLRESGRPVFRDVAEAAGVRDVAAGMSACWGDYDNDGRPDLYIGNMFSSAGNRIAFQDRFKADGDAGTKALLQRHARGNSLFHNAGQGTFEDVSVASGTTMGRWAWSSLFADLDNDGWEDLLVANGFITQEDTGDL